MITGEARALRQRDPRPVAARRSATRTRESPVFLNNPNMATSADIASGNVQWLDQDAGRRYREARSRVNHRVWTDIGPTRGEFYFLPEETEFAAKADIDGCIVIEPTIKQNASVNKDWGFENWRKLVALAPDLPWLQFAPVGSNYRRLGVRILETPSYRHAAAALKRCKAAVLPEGGLHHAAAAVWTPAVVIFGGFISPKQTGYQEHRNIFTGGEPCGTFRACDHCRAAMKAITPEMVLAELKTILSRDRDAA